MLGQMRAGSSWVWAAYGKHPSAKDYIRIGESFPLMNSFQEWVERGYGMAAPKAGQGVPCYSWRFWARGLQKNAVVCGLLKDSSDSLGRSFPLLIMGAGLLEEWEKEWDLMPYVCENAWARMEYLAAQAGDGLTKIGEGIQTIKPPYADWSRYERVRLDCKKEAKALGSRGLKNDQESRSGFGCVIANLDSAPRYGRCDPVGNWHYFFRSSADAAPNAVFVGGTMSKAYIAVFRKSLSPDDFKQLWTV